MQTGHPVPDGSTTSRENYLPLPGVSSLLNSTFNGRSFNLMTADIGRSLLDHGFQERNFPHAPIGWRIDQMAQNNFSLHSTSPLQADAEAVPPLKKVILPYPNMPGLHPHQVQEAPQKSNIVFVHYQPSNSPHPPLPQHNDQDRYAKGSLQSDVSKISADGLLREMEHALTASDISTKKLYFKKANNAEKNFSIIKEKIVTLKQIVDEQLKMDPRATIFRETRQTCTRRI